MPTSHFYPLSLASACHWWAVEKRGEGTEKGGKARSGHNRPELGATQMSPQWLSFIHSTTVPWASLAGKALG